MSIYIGGEGKRGRLLGLEYVGMNGTTKQTNKKIK